MEENKKDYEEGKQVVRIDNFGVLLNLMKSLVQTETQILKTLRFTEDKIKKELEILEAIKLSLDSKK